MGPSNKIPVIPSQQHILQTCFALQKEVIGNHRSDPPSTHWKEAPGICTRVSISPGQHWAASPQQVFHRVCFWALVEAKRLKLHGRFPPSKADQLLCLQLGKHLQRCSRGLAGLPPMGPWRKPAFLLFSPVWNLSCCSSPFCLLCVHALRNTNVPLGQWHWPRPKCTGAEISSWHSGETSGILTSGCCSIDESTLHLQGRHLLLLLQLPRQDELGHPSSIHRKRKLAANFDYNL